MQTNLDLYTDYLLSSFGQTSATNMARLMDDQISHDDVTASAARPLFEPTPSDRSNSLENRQAASS